MDSNKTVPAGFSRHDRRSGLTDPWEPLFAATTDRTFSLGLYADTPHVNSRGFVHGGLLSALADNAMGLSCARQIDNVGGLVTVNLSIDYLGTARKGEWLEIRAEPSRIGQSLCFAEARILSHGTLCATAKAVFKVSLLNSNKEKQV
ncbi:PaaI family thioesterase [Marinobacter sp. LN3S78]|uniref:PaaI family thioesterase n=1 Tax=Marinobacter sp. LN3S78 TaxID=3382300 RepID=UPI00387B2020